MTHQDSTRAQRDNDASHAWRQAYDAAQDGAVLFDRSNEGRLRITGKDRVSWLQGLVSNDVAALGPGEGCEAAYLTPQGRMISDLRVLAREHEFLIDVPAITRDSVRDRFDMFVITEDVTIEDVSATISRLAVHGEGASRIVAGAFGWTGSPSLEEHQSLRISADDDVSVLVAGARTFGYPAFDLYLPVELADKFTSRLVTAGAVKGDERTWNTLRIESGVPAFGVDMDENTIPLEAGLEERAISQTKGCYVGQEVIIRVLHRGHGRVARKLVGLAPPARDRHDHHTSEVIVQGASLHAANDGREIGRITSAAFSPRLGHAIALGYVQRDFIAPGTTVEARCNQRSVMMTVREVPFV